MSGSRIFRHFTLILAGIISVGPIVFSLLESLKTPIQIATGSWSFVPTLGNYFDLIAGPNSVFLQLTFNSVVASVTSTIVVLLFSTLAAYSLSSHFHWPRSIKSALMFWLLFVQMVPAIVFLGPFYLISRQIGIYNSPAALVMAYLVLNLPLAVWIMIGFFSDVPAELREAATIDGSSNFRTFVTVMLPIVSPGLTATGLLSFIFAWNDFIFALGLTSTPAGMTLPVGIAGFAQQNNTLFADMSAAGFFAAIPAVILVLFAQKYIVRGLTLGALK